MLAAFLLVSNVLAWNATAYNSVEGWFSAAQTWRAIMPALHDKGIHGAYAEIGVHHGKSFLHLLDLAQPGTKVLAMDVFEDQQFNLDHSGWGSRSIFTNNLVKVLGTGGGKPEQLVIHKADSTKLRPQQVTRLVDGQPIVWFSVDGCHTYECTKSDIALAMATLHEMGVICVDDYYNQDWPGVATGANAFLAANIGLAVAFAYGENKLYICKHRAEESSSLRVAEAHSCLRDAMQLADGLGAQLEHARSEHGLALLRAEAEHQQELRALLEARETGVLCLPSVSAGVASAATAEAEAQAGARLEAHELTQARQNARDACDEVSLLRMRVLELEAQLHRSPAGAAEAARRAAEVGGSAGQGRKGSVGARLSSPPTVARPAKRSVAGLGQGRRAARVVSEESEAEAEAEVEASASASETETESEESEEEAEQEDSDVDWIDTAEARQVIPRANRPLRSTLARAGTQQAATSSEEGHTSSGSAAGSVHPPAPAPREPEGARIATRRRSQAVTQAVSENSASNAQRSHLGAAAVDALLSKADDASAPSSAGESGLALPTASLSKMEAKPKRAPLGVITNRSSNVPAGKAANAHGTLPLKQAVQSDASTKPAVPDGALAEVSAKLAGVARRKGLYVDRRAKSDLSALFADDITS